MVPVDARVKLLGGLLVHHHHTDPRGTLASPTGHTHFIRDGAQYVHHQLLDIVQGNSNDPGL
jgi:hypothetical protein